MNKDTPLRYPTEIDSTWNDYATNQMEHEVRDNRNLLIAAVMLRYLRQNYRSKAWLADRMGMDPQRLVAILKGRGNMTPVSISNLENATGLHLFDDYT